MQYTTSPRHPATEGRNFEVTFSERGTAYKKGGHKNRTILSEDHGASCHQS